MFLLREESEGRWSVTDQAGELIFTGTLAECEDWLDSQEARQAKSVWGRVWSWFRRLAVRSGGWFSLVSHHRDDPAPPR